MDLLSRLVEEIAARPSGPLALRFYLQPAVASLLALRDGIHDAKMENPPYLKTLFVDRSRRRELMRDGWRSVGKVFMIALALDLVYQFFVLRGFRPVETIVVAVALAIIPYVFLRGPANRLARRLSRGGRHRPAHSR